MHSLKVTHTSLSSKDILESVLVLVQGFIQHQNKHKKIYSRLSLLDNVFLIFFLLKDFIYNVFKLVSLIC